MSKSKARKLAIFLGNLTEDSKIETDAVEQEDVVTSRADLESKSNDTRSIVTPAAVTSFVENKLGDYLQSTHDIDLTFTGDATGSETITDMGNTTVDLTVNNIAGSLQVGGNLSVGGTGYLDLPTGTTAQRPLFPNAGYTRFNIELGLLEFYRGNEWKVIEGSPRISNLSTSFVNASDSTQTVIINGENFTGANVTLIAKNNSVIYPTTVIVNSRTQITITFSGSDTLTDNSLEPFDINIATDSGLVVGNDLLRINNAPTWTTPIGQVATVFEGITPDSIQLTASDPDDDDTLTYSIVTGSLPLGMELSSSGLISGTPSVGDEYTTSGVQHNFTVQATDGAVGTSRAFYITRKWKVGDTADNALETSEIASLTTTGMPSAVRYVNLPTVGPTPVFIDSEYDGGGWILVLAGDAAVGDASPSAPRAGVGAYPKDDPFYLGNRGSNQSYNFDGYTLNTSISELLFKHLPFTTLRVAGTSTSSVDSSGFDFTDYYDQPAWEAYKSWSFEMTSSETSTFAQKLNNLTPWSQGRNAKQNLVYDQSWSTSYSAGNFKLGFRNTSGPAYGDYINVWIAGGQAERKNMSSSLWRERHPNGSFGLYNNPTTVAVAIGYAGHRGGGSHYNNSLWFKAQ